jgi:Ty3 transposon capsid-like protein
MTPSTRLSQAAASNCSEESTTTTSDLPFSDPKSFDGSNMSCANFLRQLKLNFIAAPDRFATDKAKCIHLLGHLTGPAWDWVAPMVDRDSPILENYDLLTESLSGVFGHPDIIQNAMNRLTALRQGEDSVATYASKYQTIAAPLPWEQTFLIHIFYLGLNSNIKKGLGTTPYPKTLQEMATNATRMEHLLVQIAEEETRETQTSHQSRPPNFTLSAVPAFSAEPSSKGLDTSKLTVNDVIKALNPRDQRRITRNLLGLCRFCGADDHKVEACPKLKNRPPLKGKAQSQ